MIVTMAAPPAWAAYPHELYKRDPAFRQVVRATLGKVPPPWLSRLNGVQSPVEEIAAGARGDPHLLIRVCKPHNCDTDHAVILYSPKHQKAYGKLERAGQVTTLGKPPPDIRLELDSLLRVSH